VGGAETRIVQNTLKLRGQQIADLLLLAEKLLVERVQAGELLIGELTSEILSAGHGVPRNWEFENRNLECEAVGVGGKLPLQVRAVRSPGVVAAPAEAFEAAAEFLADGRRQPGVNVF